MQTGALGDARARMVQRDAARQERDFSVFQTGQRPKISQVEEEAEEWPDDWATRSMHSKDSTDEHSSQEPDPQ